MAPSKTLADQPHDRTSHVGSVTSATLWRHYWHGGLPITKVTGGSGNVFTQLGARSEQFATGATINSVCGVQTRLYDSVLSAGLSVGKCRRALFMHDFGNETTNLHAYLFVTSEAGSAEPSVTVDHFGIERINGTTYFSSADGTTEQTTDISAYVVNSGIVIYVVEFDGTTANCYVNGTLRATHVTRVPRSTEMRVDLRAFLTNTAAEAKAMYYGLADLEFAI